MALFSKKGNEDKGIGERLTLVQIIAFIITLMVFSGAFGNSESFLRVFDLQTLSGAFGVIVDGARPGFVGAGGYGAREGFLQSLNMAPMVIVAMAFISIVDNYGGLHAAKVLMSPILRPILGVRGSGAVAIIINWQNSDAMAAYLREQVDKKGLTKNERDILVTYGFTATATIGVFYSTIALLFPHISISPGILLGVIMVMKFVAGNLMRIYNHFFEKEYEELAENGSK